MRSSHLQRQRQLEYINGQNFALFQVPATFSFSIKKQTSNFSQSSNIRINQFQATHLLTKMRFTTASISLLLAVLATATAVPAAEPVADAAVLDKRRVPQHSPVVFPMANNEHRTCGQDYVGLATCEKNCPHGKCHVIALGPLHKCEC